MADELGGEMPQVVYEPRAFSEAADAIAPGSLDGLLADFGVSSMQLDEPHRGFSFRPMDRWICVWISGAGKRPSKW